MNSPDAPFSHPYRCSDCGSEVGFRSRRRSLVERFLLPVVLMQPVRCGECFRRDYRMIFTPVRDRLSEIPRMIPGKQPSRPNRNVA
jgi:DNA-directed RNA polymerase subunit RPC12/RpoP